MTIRDFVKSNIGETYDKLTDTAGFDEQDKPDVVGMKIAASLGRFGVEEGDLNTFQKSYVGDHATLALIPVAMDYYMVQTRLIDNFSRPAGITVGGGEVGQNYDRIAALRRIAEEIRARMADDGPTFIGTLPGLVGDGMRTDNTEDPLTIDPLTFEPSVGVLVGAAFGVAYQVNPG
jgi:hypothetical protein